MIDAWKAMEAWLDEDCPHRPEWLAPEGAWKRHAYFEGSRDVDLVETPRSGLVCFECLADLFASLREAARDIERIAAAWAWDQARLASIDAANLEAERNDLRAENARLREALQRLDDTATEDK